MGNQSSSLDRVVYLLAIHHCSCAEFSMNKASTSTIRVKSNVFLLNPLNSHYYHLRVPKILVLKGTFWYLWSFSQATIMIIIVNPRYMVFSTSLSLMCGSHNASNMPAIYSAILPGILTQDMQDRY